MSEVLGASYSRLVWNQFKRQTMAVGGLIAIAVLLVMALCAPLLAGNRPIVMKRDGVYSFPAFSSNPVLKMVDFSELRDRPPEGYWAIYPVIPYSYDEPSIDVIYDKPSWNHWMGTDDIGRDIAARIVWGARTSLLVGFVAVGIYMAIGTVLGALAGFFGGIVDHVVSRCIEVMTCLPTLVFLIAAMAFLGPGLYKTMLVIGLISWPSVARLARAEFLRLRHSDFVAAIRVLGGSPVRIMFRHILPNALAPILVAATFGVASAIILESTLSFLGFGVPEPHPTWGGILSAGRSSFSSWWLTVFPGSFIFITVLSYNLVGEGLRNAVDARLKT